MNNPVCPKCGCPARVVVIIRARVRCILNEDRSVGRVLSASRGEDLVVGYECGGGHEWKEDNYGKTIL